MVRSPKNKYHPFLPHHESAMLIQEHEHTVPSCWSLDFLYIAIKNTLHKFSTIIVMYTSGKKFLENFWYNLFMTAFQDLPQTILTIIEMFKKGLPKNPDNPTGVSLPGFFNLIPQAGNATAGFALFISSLYDAHQFKKDYKLGFPGIDNSVNKILLYKISFVIKLFTYTIFSIATILNGLSNFIHVFYKNDDLLFSNIARISSNIALAFNFIILTIEEISILIKLIQNSQDPEESSRKEDAFHLICSFFLNISIFTALLAVNGWASPTIGAIGYLIGTYLGQIPELFLSGVTTVRAVSWSYCNIGDSLRQEDYADYETQSPHGSPTISSPQV